MRCLRSLLWVLLVALAWTENGFRHMTNSKRDIVKPADAAGLKMRTMENKVHMDGYRTFGILPTPMAFPELFGALQQGDAVGRENASRMAGRCDRIAQGRLCGGRRCRLSIRGRRHGSWPPTGAHLRDR